MYGIGKKDIIVLKREGPYSFSEIYQYDGSLEEVINRTYGIFEKAVTGNKKVGIPKDLSEKFSNIITNSLEKKLRHLDKPPN